jgi:hypothetical protein
MLLVECRGMTAEASFAKILSPAGDRLMRVVTSPAPQSPTAIPSAGAECQLLGVTDNLDFSACRLCRNKRCECIFETLARDEISKLLAGIRYANLSC